MAFNKKITRVSLNCLKLNKNLIETKQSFHSGSAIWKTLKSYLKLRMSIGDVYLRMTPFVLNIDKISAAIFVNVAFGRR